MADLTKPRITPEQANSGKSFVDPVSAGTKLFRGSMAGLDALGNAVKAAPAVATMRGVVKETVDNTEGITGALSVEVMRGVFQFSQTDLDRTHIGSDVFVVDDNTVGAAGILIAGKLLQIEAGGAWVEIL